MSEPTRVIVEVKDGKVYPVLCDKPTHLYVLDYDIPRVTVHIVDMSNPKTREEWLEIIGTRVESYLSGESETDPSDQSQSDRNDHP